jgi:hypothetical protein
MLEKIKDNLLLIMAIGILALGLMLIKSCKDASDAKQRYDNFDKSLSAIESKITKTKNAQGDSVFVKGAASITLKDLVNSDAFKNLSAQNQQFFTELQKVKGLVASANATIQSQSEIIQTLKPQTGETVTKDSLDFKRGSKLVIQDSTPHLKFNHTLILDNPIKSDLKYTYQATIQTSFIRNKDKSIRVEYKLDDDKATVTNGQAFIIPQEQQTPFAKFLDKQARWVLPVATLVGGVYIGAKILK